MKKTKNAKLLFFSVVILVFILNVIQGGLTELLPDEAYYWVYSQHMDWGFFDHPPLVAVWISISEFLFSNEIGVRFFSAISFSFLLYIVWKTIDHPKKEEYTWLFLLIILSTALLNVYGFITTPDTPLMLFVALFLYAYKEYLSKKSLSSYLLLAISVAGMMYSKYQGILIVFFVVLSNLRMVRDPRLWLTALLALVLYLPHLYWQWANDFPSFRYHLQERVSNRTYKFEHTLMHFVNMIAIIGLTFPIIYKAFFKNIRTKDTYNRGLNFIIFGFLLFFFFSSFRGRVQAQWIVPISIPLILITYNYLTDREKARKWFVRLAFINIAIMLIARVLMFAEGIVPVKLNTHGNEAWALELQSDTPGQEKIFINSYQNTATYWYYTGEKAYYMKNFTGRNNHFVLLQENEDLSAKQAALVSRIRLDHTDFGTHIRGKDSVFTTVVNDYKDLSQIEIQFTDEEIVLKKNTPNSFDVEITNHFNRTISPTEFEVSIGFIKARKKEKHILKALLQTKSTTIAPGETIKGIITFNTEEIPNPEIFTTLGIGMTNSNKIDIIRVSKLHKYLLKD
ncbi:ArnT family glycosyltransferase [Pseudotenacibaculum haliotis]|uniref:ArnT family glycosyltransferase n=1 Tax=Pseudotenacibaculum haliotis TaxID=1862138 RepID=A0ABW5LUM0_9FLAO